MNNTIIPTDVFGFIKTKVDVHTMGVFTMANLLRECGYKVVISNDDIGEAVENLQKVNNYSLLKHWIQSNHISVIAFSYRMDPQDACDYFMTIFEMLRSDNMFSTQGGLIKKISFAGLPDACNLIAQKTNSQVILFPGNETPVESLRLYGVPDDMLPKSLVNNNPYDNMLWNFAKGVIERERWKLEPPQDHYGYSECGTDNDAYVLRLKYARSKHALPIIRTHSGPYSDKRLEALNEYNAWCKELAASQLLDVLSIGSSQLTQSDFGGDWDGKPNGGGVPVNSEIEYRIIRENARPMLVRTYSGTKNVPQLAQIHERALNISWHALSFWWFDELDGRGNNSLLENLREHFEAIRYIASTGKPVEPNVPHHFAFRGSDDITFIVSGYLAAKAIKKLGISHMILQIMLNTPKYTWGVQDLAKARAMLKLVRDLEDDNFSVSLQTRGGLDYFSPDLDEAKIQLAAVTCMMDDIEPENDNSPEIIHVVNYSEAVRLATPPVIKDSIKITLNALHAYRSARKKGIVPNMEYDTDVKTRYNNLLLEARVAIRLLEDNIPNLYTPEGFEMVFKEGFFPVPYLMDFHNRWSKARMWKTALKNGGISVVDTDGNIINTADRYHYIIDHFTY